MRSSCKESMCCGQVSLTIPYTQYEPDIHGLFGVDICYYKDSHGMNNGTHSFHCLPENNANYGISIKLITLVFGLATSLYWFPCMQLDNLILSI